jgi:signal transduction histidine kinase
LSPAQDEQQRWRLLLDAVVTMAAGLSLDDLLTRIVDVAGDLAAAKYVALGVLGSSRERRLRLFVTKGLSGEQTARIGEPPAGRGVLGLLIDHPEPVRLHEVTRHPQSYGFPAGHPPMHSFLGVPVMTGEKVFGNLYLAEKIGGGDFTAEDEEIVTALAAAAGVAIENALLHEEAQRRERWLDARAEVTSALMGETDRVSALQLVADRAREVADADLAWVLMGPEAEFLEVEVASGDADLEAAAGLGTAAAGRAVRSGVPLALEDLEVEGLGPAVMVPLTASGDPEQLGDADAVGVLALAWRQEHAERAQEVDLAVANAFAEQVALAIRLAHNRADRERLAVYADRDRIGRDLHDIVIQRLFAIGLSLQGGLKWTDDPQLRDRIDEAVDEIDETIRDIRRSIFELASVPEDGDIQSQVTELVDRAASSLKFRPTLAFEGPIRLTITPPLAQEVLAVLGEALSNTARHAHASQVDVELVAGHDLVLRVRDDGVGVPADAVESGLANMRRRATARGGHCTVTPAEPSGTLVEWSVPLG